MATTLLLFCGCGQKYSVYIPKSTIAGEWMQIPGDWDEVDKQEEADGEIDLGIGIAEGINSVFVDLRETKHVLCRRCGAGLDLWAIIRNRITAMIPDGWTPIPLDDPGPFDDPDSDETPS